MLSAKINISVLLLTLLFACNEEPKVEESNNNVIEEIEIIEAENVESISKENDTLYAFVGEQISFEPIDYEGRDPAFLASYKILENVYNEFENDTIEFIVYDHWGNPKLRRFKHSLVFVSTFQGKLYHEKYQFFDVYQTKQGKWAGPGNPYRNDIDTNIEKTIVAERIDFKSEVSFDISSYDTSVLEKAFPKEFYKKIDGRAYPFKGNYVQELFEVKKNGVLKSRGWLLE